LSSIRTSRALVTRCLSGGGPGRERRSLATLVTTHPGSAVFLLVDKGILGDVTPEAVGGAV
jgi:hypothetical protein